MSLPTVVAVDPRSPAARAGLLPGDEIVSIAGQAPRDVIEYRLLTDEPDPELDVRRGGLDISLVVAKDAGEPIGIEIQSAVFDRVQTCDNHCEFCFIYQLPPGMRRSLYLKDDDYRLSFLYGNFTTLTRFTEADFERVVSERLSPLYVSIHATSPDVRARMLRNRRGATSLRWLSALLEAGIEVHGQVVVCPEINDGAVFADTLCGVLDRFPSLASVGVVPLGVSRYSNEPAMRAHTLEEAAAVLDIVSEWQSVFVSALGRRMVFAADEFYLLAGRAFPAPDEYEGFPQIENGIGMARAFELSFSSVSTASSVLSVSSAEAAEAPRRRSDHFFAAVDGAFAYRGPRAIASVGSSGPAAVLTGVYGASVLGPLLDGLDVRIVPVDNQFFGGNIAVTGLMVGADVARVLALEPPGWRYLLPDVCLNGGVFLDGVRPDQLPRPVEIVPTDGRALLEAVSG